MDLPVILIIFQVFVYIELTRVIVLIINVRSQNAIAKYHSSIVEQLFRYVVTWVVGWEGRGGGVEVLPIFFLFCFVSFLMVPS